MALLYITHTLQDILLSLYRFRFLHRIQIQTILNTKDTRNLNRRLQDLTDKKYIGRKYSKKLGENIIPATYYLTINGLKFLKTLPHFKKENLKKLHQEERKSKAFIAHCSFIADRYIALSEKYHQHNYHFKFYTQSDFLENAQIRDVLPSCAYVFESNNDLRNIACEIFKEKMPRYAIRGRIKKYREYFEKDTDNQLVDIIFICPNNQILGYVERYIEKLNQEGECFNANIYIATKDQIEENGMEITFFKKANID